MLYQKITPNLSRCSRRSEKKKLEREIQRRRSEKKKLEKEIQRSYLGGFDLIYYMILVEIFTNHTSAENTFYKLYLSELNTILWFKTCQKVPNYSAMS